MAGKNRAPALLAVTAVPVDNGALVLRLQQRLPCSNSAAPSSVQNPITAAWNSRGTTVGLKVSRMPSPVVFDSEFYKGDASSSRGTLELFWEWHCSPQNHVRTSVIAWRRCSEYAKKHICELICTHRIVERTAGMNVRGEDKARLWHSLLWSK